MSRRAFLVGVDQSLSGKLDFAEADAVGVANSLRKNYGFADNEIILLKTKNSDIYHQSMRNVIEKQLTQIRDDKLNLDFFLFGFWGHGFVRHDRRYLSAMDTNKDDLERTGLSLSTVMETLAQIGALNTCLLLDCCQTEPGRGEGDRDSVMTSGEEEGLRHLASNARDIIATRRDQIFSDPQEPMLAILNSCSKNQKAYEWPDRKHGIFTAHLLDVMDGQAATVQDWMDYVGRNVPQTARQFFQKQNPFFEIRGGGGTMQLINPPIATIFQPQIQPQPRPQPTTQPETFITSQKTVISHRTETYKPFKIVENIKKAHSILTGCAAMVAKIMMAIFVCFILFFVGIALVLRNACINNRTPYDNNEIVKPSITTSELPAQLSSENTTAPSKEARTGDRKTMIINGIEYVFRWCPPGTFVMGSPEDEKNRSDAETQHKVTLTKGFWMLESEVTQEMWESVMEENPSAFRNSNFPVENVSWEDCQEFLSKLNHSNDIPLEWEAKLPTEAQWEYACRAGGNSAFSGNLEQIACYFGNCKKSHLAVKSKNSNVWGLYDMHGNVFEWCEDWYGDYPTDSVSDPTGPSTALFRVYRGGCWSSSEEYCRCACRNSCNPTDRLENLGFRIVLSSVEKMEQTSAFHNR